MNMRPATRVTLRLGDGPDVTEDCYYMLQEWALRVCGGFTYLNGMGGWIDDHTDRTYYEPSRTMIMIVPFGWSDVSERDRAAFDEAVLRFKVMAEELMVLVEHETITHKFI